ncbi:MAG: hypothetical protein IT382_22960 [Deltaproteobacteria bacterium]|nr:hypothetical protein [Deltaproteobacteria bacterium]
MRTLAPIALALAALVSLASGSSQAETPYNPSAGRNAPAAEALDRAVRQPDGTVKHETVYVPPKRDSHGNAQGNQYDLAVDGAFEGQTVAVLHFYTGEGFDFSLPQAALKQKGFSVFRWINAPPAPKELREKLKLASQLWIISNSDRRLSDEHIAVIKEFFDSGKGVYIWGDNQPYYADANAVGQALLGVQMTGDLPGGSNVGIQRSGQKAGVLPNHLLSTGIENVFEGITIATIDGNQTLKPLIYGSAGNLVTAVYEGDGKRAIFDGGFTRLYLGWETAGTARYVKNAAAWLANFERFGTKVVATK